MKVPLLILLFISSTTLAQDSTVSRISVFYFGGTDCTYCMIPDNIQRINTMREELPNKHTEIQFKFILVVMDEEISRGIEYIKKYPNWSEVSIGEWYNNELMLEHVNRAEIPGVPHIIIYKDLLTRAKGKYNVPIISKRTLLQDIVGATPIKNWIMNGYPLE